MNKIQLTKKYKRYPEYKDSGVEWLGKIPKDWEKITLKRLFRFQSGDGFPDNLQGRQSGAVPFMKVSDINGVGRYVSSANNYVDLKIVKEKSWHLIPAGSILMPKIGAALSKNHRKINTIPVCIDNNMLAVVPQSILKEFSYWTWKMLNMSDFENISSVPSVNLNQLRNYSLAIPDIGEQEKITKYLDEKTSYIDEIIKKKEKQIELLKEEIVSIAQNEQMGGKGKTIRIRDLYKLAEEPIELEDYSEYVALGLYNRGRGLFHKELQFGKDIKESDFYKVKPRDLIISGQFAWEGAVALASVDESESVVSHRYYLLRDGVIKTEYLLALLMTKFGDHILNESSRGSAGRNRPLNIKILLKEKIRVPSKEAETRIESLLIKMNSVRNNIKKSISLLEEYKSSLISNVVTGKIKV